VAALGKAAYVLRLGQSGHSVHQRCSGEFFTATNYNLTNLIHETVKDYASTNFLNEV
jgi:hypothetical protein